MNVAVLLVVCYLAFGAVLFVMQRSFIYFPSARVSHGYEELNFESGPETLKVVLLNSENRNAILYFGGNAEVVAHNGPEFERSLSTHAVYLVNYRGYGGSSGAPTEEGLYADAIKLYDQLAPLYGNLSVMGRSLGSGVATYLASERPVAKLVLITPFDSIENVARSRFPIYPMSLLLKDKYKAATYAGSVVSDVLVLIAAEDEVIPRARTDSLVASFDQTSPRVVVFDNAGHNDISLYEKYYPVIADFLR